MVAQGGGPTPVINCSLLGVVEKAAKYSGVKGIFGALGGITGVLEERMIDLRKERKSVLSGLVRTPGAALGSSRRKVDDEDCRQILSVFARYNIRYFFYIGGNDSMDTANKINVLAGVKGYDLRVIGIPKTVDNDLEYSDHSPGYGSAARYVATITREIGIDNESLSPPVCVIETMGRDAGWVAAASALAKEKPEDAPHLIYLPEREVNIETLLKDVKEMHARLGRTTLVVSEGIKDEAGEYLGAVKSEVLKDNFGHRLLGGSGAYIAGLITERLNLRTRYEKPGLCGRTSMAHASTIDRREAYMAGRTAVRYAKSGKTGYMVVLVRDREEPYHCSTGLVELGKVANAQKLLPDEFVSPDGNSATEAFRRYCLPLIGSPLSKYVRLGKYQVRSR
jgi:6-phosphofructokinase 1